MALTMLRGHISMAASEGWDAHSQSFQLGLRGAVSSALRAVGLEVPAADVTVREIDQLPHHPEEAQSLVLRYDVASLNAPGARSASARLASGPAAFEREFAGALAGSWGLSVFNVTASALTVTTLPFSAFAPPAAAGNTTQEVLGAATLAASHSSNKYWEGGWLALWITLLILHGIVHMAMVAALVVFCRRRRRQQRQGKKRGAEPSTACTAWLPQEPAQPPKPRYAPWQRADPAPLSLVAQADSFWAVPDDTLTVESVPDGLQAVGNLPPPPPRMSPRGPARTPPLPPLQHHPNRPSG